MATPVVLVVLTKPPAVRGESETRGAAMISHATLSERACYFGWRWPLAASFVGLGVMCFVGAGAILASDLSPSWKAAAGLLFPLSELCDLVAVAVVGRPGLTYLKGLALVVIKRSRRQHKGER